MKQVLIFVLSCACLVSCDVRKKNNTAAASQEVRKLTETKPTTVQMLDSVYNFGKVTEGAVVEYSFRFKNTGQNPLVITDAVGSCGCTVAEKPEQPVLPGDIGYMKVKFNSDKRVGEARKTVTVISNASPAFPELILKGKVLPKNEN